jgi:mycothiol system anti-sigma-R factor
MINCIETLRRFYDYLDRELPDQQAGEVEEHLEGCKKCLDRMEFEKLYNTFVQKNCDMDVSTEQLKDQILSKIRDIEQSEAGADDELFPDHEDHADVDNVPLPAPFGEDRSGSGRIPFWSYVLVAAALILTALPFVLPDKIGEVPTNLAPLAAIHHEGTPDYANTDASLLSNWIVQRAAHEPMIEMFAMAGCALKGASVDSIWSVLFAEAEGIPLSVFVADARLFPVPEGMKEVQLGDYTVWTAEEPGMVYVVWEYHPDGLVCAALASGDMDTVLRLVRQIEDLIQKV